MYADITRPVYGLSLVTNSQEVVLAGSEPEWRDSGGIIEDAELYEDKTVNLWRKQWLNISLTRASRISNEGEEGYER